MSETAAGISTVDREAIAALEREVEVAKERLAEARRRLPVEPIGEYVLLGAGGEGLALNDLFGERDDLLVIHNMGRRCAYCTLWADGLNGVLPHLESRAVFVVVSPDEPEVQAAFARDRGWRFRMVSDANSDFTRDMGFLLDDGYWPGVSAFHRREDGSIVRTGRAIFGPGDDFCAVWHLFGLLQGGVGGWEPEFTYGS